MPRSLINSDLGHRRAGASNVHIYMYVVSHASHRGNIVSFHSERARRETDNIRNERERNARLDTLRGYLKCVLTRAREYTLKAKLTVYLIFTDYNVGDCWILIAFT